MSMISKEFEAYLAAAYGKDAEFDPVQKEELGKAFLNGVKLGYTATLHSVLNSTRKRNVTEELHAEISAEIKTIYGTASCAIVLEPMELKSLPAQAEAAPDPEARITKLWNALAGVVGADSKDELEGMIMMISVYPVPEEEKAVMVHAMRVLIEELPPTDQPVAGRLDALRGIGPARPPEAGEAPSTTSAE